MSNTKHKAPFYRVMGIRQRQLFATLFLILNQEHPKHGGHHDRIQGGSLVSKLLKGKKGTCYLRMMEWRRILIGGNEPFDRDGLKGKVLGPVLQGRRRQTVQQRMVLLEAGGLKWPKR